LKPRRSRTKKIDKGPRGPQPSRDPGSSPSSALTLAELSIQRGDHEHGRAILERRIGQGASDFKTLELYGITLAHARRYDNAATIFSRLEKTRLSKNHRARASFNLGLTHFFQDLNLIGDLSVAANAVPKPSRGPIRAAAFSNPFARSLAAWKPLVKAKTAYHDVICTYLGFACFQLGRLDEALDYLIEALDQHENFFVTHYVVGRVFLDLFLLSMEGTPYGLQRSQQVFFDIQDEEIVEKHKAYQVPSPECLLDICLSSFAEGRELSPLSVEISLNICRAYMMAGLYEEAQAALELAETILPDSPTVLETSLFFCERVQSGEEHIQGLIRRLENMARKHREREVDLIIVPYYLF